MTYVWYEPSWDGLENRATEEHHKSRGSDCWNQDRCGAVTREMAPMLPFFTTLVFGIIKFERVFLIMQLVTNAAREGCRRAVIDGSTNNDVTHYTQTFMQTSANVATAIRTVTVIVTPATGNTANPTSDLASSASRDLVHVKMPIGCNAVQLISAKYLSGKTLKGEASMRQE